MVGWGGLSRNALAVRFELVDGVFKFGAASLEPGERGEQGCSLVGPFVRQCVSIGVLLPRLCLVELRKL